MSQLRDHDSSRMIRPWLRNRRSRLAKYPRFKQLKRVAGLLSKLHDVGCARDKAGQRELHFDDYVLLVLL
jgi:hypothetical protein